jgi:hypothetical protein
MQFIVYIRNGDYTVGKVINNEVILVVTGITKKKAEIIAKALHDVYTTGFDEGFNAKGMRYG